ncbi:MAG: tetratricopeptide repeat protein [Bacteroidales bacterium]|jgi:tetratricopeptide (TPR) repeat protein|nr:tetratricopeptide repeat protein [Bacteroidales bacterium]
MLKKFFILSLFAGFILSFSSCNLQKKAGKDKDDPRIKQFNFNFYFLEANKQKILGNYNEALQNYQMALNVDPKQAAVCYEIAGLLNLGRDYPAALDYAKRAVELDKTGNEYYMLLLAYIYQNNNLNQESLKVYEQLLKTHPKNIHYYFEISNLYQADKKYSDAIKILDKAESVFGVMDMISVEKENIYHTIGDKQKALNEIQKLNEAFPENPRYMTILAESYVNINDFEAAKKIYDKLLSENQEEGIIYFSMADFYRIIGDYDKAFELLGRGFTREDVELEIKVKMMLSMLNNLNGDAYLNEKVGNLMQVLVSTYPNDLMVRAVNSDFLLYMQNYEAAQKEYDFILERDKDKFEIWRQALSVDFILQDMQAMYRRSKEATELFPNVLEFYQYYVVSAYATNNYKDVSDAVDYASMLITNDQQMLIEFLSLQGDALHKLGEHHRSDSVFELLLYKDAENIQALNNYSYFLAMRNEKTDRALDLSTKLITLSPDEPAYLDTHAWVLFVNKKYDEALIYIDKALEKDQSNSVYLEHKGDILYKAGRHSEALEFWKKAAENGAKSEKLNEKILQKKLVE